VEEAGTTRALDWALAVWSRRRGLALMSLLLPLTAGVSVVSFLPDVYRATATVLGLALAAVMVAEKVDTSFHGVDDLRAFSAVPVVVSIPLIVTSAALRRRRRQMPLSACATVALLVLIVGAGDMAAHGNEHLVFLLGRGGS